MCDVTTTVGKQRRCARRHGGLLSSSSCIMSLATSVSATCSDENSEKGSLAPLLYAAEILAVNDSGVLFFSRQQEIRPTKTPLSLSSILWTSGGSFQQGEEWRAQGFLYHMNDSERNILVEMDDNGEWAGSVCLFVALSMQAIRGGTSLTSRDLPCSSFEWKRTFQHSYGGWTPAQSIALSTAIPRNNHAIAFIANNIGLSGNTLCRQGYLGP